MTADGPFRLDDRVAAVTGAGSGLGAAVARALAQAGASVMCADIDAGRAEDTAQAIGATGGNAAAHVVDVSDRAAVFALVDATVARFGALDVMCNIAGISEPVLVADTREADLDRMLNITVKGAYWGCQAAAAVMVPQGRGSIINMASTALDTPTPTLSSYTVAKAGVAALTKVFATEVGPQGVRVNAVAPGFVPTPMSLRGADEGDVSPEIASRMEMIGQRTALRRVGRPDEIAYAFVFLASDASSYVTGQTLRPNGGISMPW